jgi:[acyl-carrier-protein] S-malonyltransferase
MTMKAILFPAFVRAYSGQEAGFAAEMLPHFKARLTQASDIIDSDLTSFDFETNDFLDNELKSQYISYIFCCELADKIKMSEIRFDYTAGYSMGIYAMFYYTGSVSWEVGLRMIKKAYESVLETIPANIFGMGNIIGLDLTDFNLLMKNEEAEIINVNGSHNFVIAGKISAVENVLEKAKLEGALHTRMLPVGCPYHSKYIKEATKSFAGYINHLEVGNPDVPVVSCIDQHEINSADAVRNEIINNLITPLNWQHTIEKMHADGVNVFYECGAGDSLSKLNKFISGEHKTFRFDHLDKIMNH